jgi:hypothetical protein
VVAVFGVSALLTAAQATADDQGSVPVNVSAAALRELPDSARSRQPVIAAGRATDFVDHGHGVQVFASAMPDATYLNAMKPGDSFHNLPIARGTLNSSGEFTLRADLDSIPADYRGPDGQVDLEIVVWDGRRSGQTLVSSFPSPTSDQRGGSALVKADENQVSQGTGAFAKSWLSCSTTLPSRSHVRNARIGESITADWSQSSWLTYQSSQSLTLGTAFDVSNDTVGWKTGGSVTRSSGFGVDFDPSVYNRSYLLAVELGKYKDVCYTVSSGSSTYAYTKYSFIPIRFTGGYSTGGASEFSVAECTGALGQGNWYRWDASGRAWSLSSGFDISGLVGFDVTSTSNWDSNNRLYYRQPKAGTYRVCGSNDYPSYASRILGRLV